MKLFNKTGNICSFIGHRKISDSESLRQSIEILIENLILKYNCKYFCFGSKSKFDDICFNITIKLQKKYKYIKTISYRVESEYYLNDEYKKFLLSFYDEIYFIDSIDKFGKLKYIIRNHAMIDNSNFCIFYYDENYRLDKKKYSKESLNFYQPQSGTKLAYEYALRKNKIIFNLYKKD